MDTVKLAGSMLFLSTLSLRRATPAPGRNDQDNIFLSTLSLRRATEKVPADVFYSAFLSTLSLRRATASDSLADTSEVISIHALLAESDRIDPDQVPG